MKNSKIYYLEQAVFTINYIGKYCVNICGQEIKVDDKFPINDQNQFQYAKPVENKLWVILLEKAYALYYGSYYAIEGGSPRIPIKDILQTKKVTKQIKSFTPEALWDLLKMSNEKGLIILVSSYTYYETCNKYRFVSYSDCYSILNIKLKDENEEFKAIQLKTQKEKRALSISYYGDQDQVEIKEFEIKKEKRKLYTENIFDGLIRAHALNYEKIKIKEYAKDIQRIHGELAHYFYNWYFNKTNNITLYEKIEMQDIKNIDICPPYNNSNIISIICRPQSNSLVKFRATKEADGDFMFQSNIKSSLIQQRSEEEIIKQVLIRPDKRKTIIGQDQVEAVVYDIGFDDGFALVFENEENKLFKTILLFGQENLKGINFDCSSGQILIEEPSKSRKVLQFQKQEPFEQYRFSQYEVTYTIKLTFD